MRKREREDSFDKEVMLTSSSSRFILRALSSLPFSFFPCSPLIIIFPPLYFPPLKERRASERVNTAARQMFSFLFVLEIGLFLSLFISFFVCLPSGWWADGGGRAGFCGVERRDCSFVAVFVPLTHTHAAHVQHERDLQWIQY